jgi:5-deoxy-glucuronate isomerase
MERPESYAHQRLYTRNGERDLTLTVREGDVVLVRDGYHPVVAGHGYNVYCLNCRAGSARLLSTTEDPDQLVCAPHGIKSTRALLSYGHAASDDDW